MYQVPNKWKTKMKSREIKVNLKERKKIRFPMIKKKEINLLNRLHLLLNLLMIMKLREISEKEHMEKLT